MYKNSEIMIKSLPGLGMPSTLKYHSLGEEKKENINKRNLSEGYHFVLHNLAQNVRIILNVYIFRGVAALLPITKLQIS